MPEKIESVRLARQEPLGDRVLAYFDVVKEGSPSREAYVLARQGAGWVIDERYVPPVEQTIRTMRIPVVALGAYGVDHGDTYPQVSDFGTLAALLTPTYAQRLPATDAWETPFRYLAAKDGKSFRVVSAGADKAFKPETWSLTPLHRARRGHCAGRRRNVDAPVAAAPLSDAVSRRRRSRRTRRPRPSSRPVRGCSGA